MNVGLIFGIIFSVIVIVLVLSLGVEQIISVFYTIDFAHIAKAKSDFEGAVEDTFNLDVEATQRFDLNTPKSTRFCFVDPANPGAALNYSDFSMNWEPDIVFEGIIKEEGYNLWVEFGFVGQQEGFKIDFLIPSQNFCAKSGSELFLINKGSHVDVIF